MSILDPDGYDIDGIWHKKTADGKYISTGSIFNDKGWTRDKKTIRHNVYGVTLNEDGELFLDIVDDYGFDFWGRYHLPEDPIDKDGFIHFHKGLIKYTPKVYHRNNVQGSHYDIHHFDKNGICSKTGTFLNEYGYLLDYVDGNMMDWSVRPNMIFACAFDYSPLNQDQKKSVLDVCTRELLTPKGLRTLSPKSGGYNPMYVGPQEQRDYAYHQGTAWPWLGGFYMEACLKLYKRTRLSFIERHMVGYEDEMNYHALGTIPELFDGNPPFHGRGAMSFAMNVAEILRTLKLLEKYTYQK